MITAAEKGETVTEAAEDTGPKTTAQWEPYVGTDVRRVTPKGASRTVRLLQVKGDAAHVRLGKSMKPVWVPLNELRLHERKVRPPKADPAAPANPSELYVLIDMDGKRFWFAGIGRGSDPKWVNDPRMALAYPDQNAAWAGRKYHRKRRPQVFPSHVDIKTLAEAIDLASDWHDGRTGGAAVKALARSIIDSQLPNGERAPAARVAMIAPPSEELLALFAEWERQRREVATADEIAANARVKLVTLELQLDIEIKRRALT